MSDNKTENVEEHVDITRSFCATDGLTASCCVDKSCANDDSSNESPGGVCPLPKKGVKSSKRKMRSPSTVSSTVQPNQLDQMFSQLFRSVLRPPEEKNDCKPTQSNRKDSDSESESDHDNEKNKEEDDHDSDDDDVSECDDSNCKIHDEDPRWEVMRRLLESHINITRAVSDLIHKR